MTAARHDPQPPNGEGGAAIPSGHVDDSRRGMTLGHGAAWAAQPFRQGMLITAGIE